MIDKINEECEKNGNGIDHINNNSQYGNNVSAQEDSNKIETNQLSVDTLNMPENGTISRRSSRKSRDSCRSSEKNIVRRNSKKKKLSWVINCITEAIEQTIVCEPITMKIQKSQVILRLPVLFVCLLKIVNKHINLFMKYVITKIR